MTEEMAEEMTEAMTEEMTDKTDRIMIDRNDRTMSDNDHPEIQYFLNFQKLSELPSPLLIQFLRVFQKEM